MQPPDIGFRPTIGDAIKRAAREFGDDDYLVSLDERITYAQADERSAVLARRMLARGIGKGTRVGLLFTYGSEWLLCWLAASRIGAVVEPFSTFYTARELRTALRLGDVDVLIAPPTVLKTDVPQLLEDAFPALAESTGNRLWLTDAPYLRRVWLTGDSDRAWATCFRLDAPADAGDAPVDVLAAAEAEVSPADVAVVVYTSGTTALPKGVVHTHGTVMRQSSILGPAVRSWSDLPPKYLGTMPFFWIGGILAVAGSLHEPVTLLCLPRLEPAAAMELIERERGTGVIGWPTFVQTIRAHPDYQQRDLSSAAMLVDGPADVSMRGVPGERPTHRGMSETAGSFFSTDILVVDPATGQPVRRGEEGELLVRGPGAMTGYYKKEAWEVFDDDGWFHTGDVVSQLPDDPRIFFGGRNTELIKSAGANVSPKEVEAVLDEFDEVQHSFVVGLEDEQRGESVVAVVVPRDPASFDPSVVEAKARAALSAYKVPRRYVAARTEDIPLLATGKLDRRRLTAMVREGSLPSLPGRV